MAWEPASRLWRDSLAPRPDDDYASDRDRLRVSLSSIRQAAEPIAAQIASDLPEFTVHDGTHMDALWPLIDTIAHRALSLTPSECWALGVAIILHDLGLAIAAYPGGPDELRELPGWEDARAAAIRARLGRPPTPDELGAYDPDADRDADTALLRQRHAERAAELVDIDFGGAFLVEDGGLRAALGPVAGQVAASHWWSVERVTDLGPVQGAPAGMSSAWTVRPIVLATLLRTADAAHLDALRAPRAERARRRLGKVSAEHWEFQGRLRQPLLVDDRLRFSSSQDFEADVAGAWWVCLDHLRLLDRELAGSDAVLTANALPRMAARSVEGVRDPRQLAKTVRVSGWEPVDARVEVSDVARLVKRLGGDSLYGGQRLVPLRELIQNASDAIRARGALRPGYVGEIEVRLEDEDTFSITDTGVGMSEQVLTGPLLDFGRSLWESSDLASALPGLQARGFRAAGRFGIGFFSVFMWADKVRVTSRPLTSGEDETRVLEFTDGLRSRPLLRAAYATERLHEPGTRVTLTGPRLVKKLAVDNLFDGKDLSALTSKSLARILAWVAPCLSITLKAAVGSTESVTAVEPNDWLRLQGSSLLHRIGAGELMRKSVADRCLTPIGDSAAPVGRASLTDGHTFYFRGAPGITVADGLRVAATTEFAGVMQVDRLDIARGRGQVVASKSEVSAWASDQARVLVEQGAASERHGGAVLWLGGDPGDLPLVKVNDGLLSARDLERWVATRTSVDVVDIESELSRARDHMFVPEFEEPVLGRDVIDMSAAYWGAEPSRSLLVGVRSVPLMTFVRERVARGWNCRPQDIAVAEAESTSAVQVFDADEIPVEVERWTRPSEPLFEDRSLSNSS